MSCERNGAQVELRPARSGPPGSGPARSPARTAACRSRLGGPVGWTEPIACAFCEAVAPTREYVQRHGWPEVELIARLA